MFDDILKFPKKDDKKDDEIYKNELRSYKNNMDEIISKMEQTKYDLGHNEKDHLIYYGYIYDYMVLREEWLGNVRTTENEELSVFLKPIGEENSRYFNQSPFENFKRIYEKQFYKYEKHF